MTTTPPVAAAVPPGPAGEPEDPDDLSIGPNWARHPADAVRLVVALAVFATTLLLARDHPGGVRSVSVDIANLVGSLPGPLRDALLGSVQLVAIVIPFVLLLALVRRRKLLVLAVASAALAATTMALLQGRLDASVPHQTLVAVEQTSWVTGAAFPSGAYLAGLVAALVVLGPVLSRGWRRAGVVLVAVTALARVMTKVAVPLNLAVTIGLGATIGSVILVAVGAPRRRASRREVLAGLAAAGFPATAVEPVEVGASHARTFEATTDGGGRAFVKLLGRDERDADLLVRWAKALRVKDLDDERPGWSPSRLVEHEALASLLAASRGVTTPAVLAAGATEDGDGLLVLEHVDGRCLADVPPEEISDRVLDEVWDQVARLHRQRIAHRWCTAHHVLLGPDGSATLIDLRWCRLSADDDQLAADVAQMITSTAALVGPERAVAAANRALPDDRLAHALPLVQRLAFPTDLQKVVAAQDGLLDRTRAQLQTAAEVEKYELRDIERISFAKLLSLFGGVVLTYSVLSFVSDYKAIGDALGDLDLTYLPGLLVLAVLPFLTGAMSFVAVSPRPLPFTEVTELMVGQTFLNRFTPANAGGMALRIRYLQRHGVDAASAAAGVGLTSAANGVAQVALVVGFAAWAGSTSKIGFSLPRASTVAVAVAVLALVGGLVWFTPLGRKFVRARIETSLKQVLGTLRTLLRQPSRFALLLGGALLGKVVTIGAFTQSCRALDVHTPYARLGLLFMTASTVASAAPTPGGVGAVEAALVAALTGAGVAPGPALSAVLVFRLATFWLPVLPGYLALGRLRSRNLV